MNCLLSLSSGPSCSREQASSKGACLAQGRRHPHALSPALTPRDPWRRCQSPSQRALSLSPLCASPPWGGPASVSPVPPGPRPWRSREQPSDLPRNDVWTGSQALAPAGLEWIRAGGGAGASRARPQGQCPQRGRRGCARVVSRAELQLQTLAVTPLLVPAPRRGGGPGRTPGPTAGPEAP